jgi:nicotinamidase-related amidase
MAETGKIDAAKTAILAMDCQNSIVSIYAKERGFIERAAGLLDMARSAGMLVIHVKVGFRPGLPEVSPNNPLFSALKSNPQHLQIFEGDKGDVHPALGPKQGDVVVTKHRVDAFAGTDLGQILRAKGIDTLVMFGIATSGVVLSTLLHASDADYRVIIVKDCCVDQDAELHAALVDRLFPKRGSAVTAAEMMPKLVSAKSGAKVAEAGLK